MSEEKRYMNGTKFYLNSANPEAPVVIRLKEYRGDKLHFEVSRKESLIIPDMSEFMEKNGFVRTPDKRLIRVVEITKDFIINLIYDDVKFDGVSHFFKITGNAFDIDLETLKKNFTLLKPVGKVGIGIISYHIKGSDKMQRDLLVFFRKAYQDVESLSTIAVACRQDVFNINRYMPNGIIPIGDIRNSMHSTIDEMNSFLIGEKLDDVQMISMYLDDGIRDIMKYISGINKYTKVLKRLRDFYKDTIYVGCHDNVYDFLIGLDFLGAVREVCGVNRFTIDHTCFADRNTTAIFNAVFRHKIGNGKKATNIQFAPFNYLYNREKLGNFILVDAGSSSDIYIAKYDLN